MITSENQLLEGVVNASMSKEELDRVAYVKERYRRMSESKSYLESKFQMAKQLYEAFEKHLTEGENWNTAYRFPELFGAIQRKATDLLENLPTVKMMAKKQKAKDFAIASQAVYNHTERMSNSQMEKSRVIMDTLFYPAGILYEGYTRDVREVTEVDDNELELREGEKELKVLYDGLLTERIDPRDFFVDEATSIFYDETGVQGARDCIRRRIYPFTTFRQKFKKFKNIMSVNPVTWGTDTLGYGKVPYEKETQENRMMQKYVTVLEYWSKEQDAMILIANGVEIYHGANPYKHKRLPFVMYYDYRRDDSVWGISEVEIQAPFIHAKEELNNLFILDAKLALQPAIAVSGDVQFNPEEHELQPGAVFNLRGLNNGKIQDTIMPLRFGGISQDALTVYKQLEDSQIIATGDDIRSLYSNPGQLATQTLSKREAAQKRIKTNILQNTIDSERQRAIMRFSNINQFYACPYTTMEGRVEFRRIPVDGYQVLQGGDELKPAFMQKFGAKDYFSLNDEIIGEPEDIEIEIVDSMLEENIKREEMDDLMQFIQVTGQMLQVDPTIVTQINVVGLLKQTAKKLNLDYHEVFPSPEFENDEDAVDLIINLLMIGELPEIGMLDTMKVMERVMEFRQDEVYERLRPQVKANINNFIIKLSIGYKDELKRKLKRYVEYDATGKAGQAGLAGAGQPNGQPGGSVPQTGAFNLSAPANTGSQAEAGSLNPPGDLATGVLNGRAGNFGTPGGMSGQQFPGV